METFFFKFSRVGRFRVSIPVLVLGVVKVPVEWTCVCALLTVVVLLLPHVPLLAVLACFDFLFNLSCSNFSNLVPMALN